MIVNELTLKNYQVHAHTNLKFPRTGLVLITGPNGSGKSSILDAVAVACWGKTLRGETPWEEGRASGVEIVMPGVRLVRSRSESSKTHLHAWMNGVEVAKAATTTKAQESVSGAFSTFEVWRRTSALSAADAAHFSLASPTERGKLLEEVLGLEKFDTALASIIQELRPLEVELPRKRGQRDTLEALKRGKRELLASLYEPPAEEEVRATDAAYELAEKEMLKSRGDVMRSEATLQDAGMVLRIKRDAFKDANVRYDHAAQSSECPTCLQKVGEEFLQSLQATRDELARDIRKATIVYEEVEAKHREVLKSDAEVHARYLAAHSASRDCQLREMRAAEQQAQRAEAQAAIDKANEDLTNLIEEESDLTNRINVLLAAKQVLQPSGVRARLLSGALEGAESVANTWLDRMGAEVHIRLRPFTELASGAIKDAVTLELGGVPPNPDQWKPYGACSGGQRRRVDVALVMALGEVASAALGRQPGTLWLDEVGDHLDAQGVLGFCEALREESKKRCVVVITHNEGLVRGLAPDAHYHVTNGMVERVI